MNQIEKERILQMIAEGMISSQEGAKLLAALSAPSNLPVERVAEQENAKNKSEEKRHAPVQEVEVQLQRADGTYYSVRVPPTLAPMIWEVTKATIREGVRAAVEDISGGMKAIIRRNTDEIRQTVKERMAGKKKELAVQEALPALIENTDEKKRAARQQLLILVQEGKVSPEAAGRLILQLDSHFEYAKKQAEGAGT